MNYVLFGAFAATITAAASFLCGIIYQEVLNGSNIR